MDRAVAKGVLSPGEFHRRRAEMMESLSSGVDDGATRTCSESVLVVQRRQRLVCSTDA